MHIDLQVTFSYQSGVYQVKDVDDKVDYDITLKCMKNIGFSLVEIEHTLNLVVGILLLG